MDSAIQQDIKTMMKIYHANPNDYIYKVMRRTADYEIVSYTFRDPDKTQDVLPSKGTRVYDGTAIYRAQ